MKINENYPELTSQLEFLNRYGLLTQAFLSTLIEKEEDLVMIQSEDDVPSSDPCVLEAIELLKTAKENANKIMVCGDYDCDGITSTTMLIHLLQKNGFVLGETLGYYIPNRLEEGYGVTKETIISASQKGYNTFIFVDNGVKAFEAIAEIKKRGHSLLIMDHHQIEEPIDDVCVMHPDYMEPYFDGLCGAGLVYVLANTMNQSDAFIETLGAIGTIGDVMDLKYQNRVLVKKGLKHLNENPLPVISSLLNRPTDSYTAEFLSYQVVPVFNAVGRLSDLGNVNQVVKYLLSDDPVTIQFFATQMKELNQKRKAMSQQMSQDAFTFLTDHSFQVIFNPEFHEGLVGIIAGQIARGTSKPALVMTQKGDVIKGSARSNHFNVYHFLDQFSEHYEAFGGHENACALTIPAHKFDAFRKAVNEAMDEVSLDEPSMDALIIDAKAFTVDAYDELMEFAPFGQGFDLMDVLLECRVTREIKLRNAGYKWQIEPIGDITEVVYFGNGNPLISSIDRFRVVGKLQKGYHSGLSINAATIIQEVVSPHND